MTTRYQKLHEQLFEKYMWLVIRSTEFICSTAIHQRINDVVRKEVILDQLVYSKNLD